MRNFQVPWSSQSHFLAWWMVVWDPPILGGCPVQPLLFRGNLRGFPTCFSSHTISSFSRLWDSAQAPLAPGASASALPGSAAQAGWARHGRVLLRCISVTDLPYKSYFVQQSLNSSWAAGEHVRTHTTVIQTGNGTLIAVTMGRDQDGAWASPKAAFSCQAGPAAHPPLPMRPHLPGPACQWGCRGPPAGTREESQSWEPGLGLHLVLFPSGKGQGMGRGWVGLTLSLGPLGVRLGVRGGMGAPW